MTAVLKARTNKSVPIHIDNETQQKIKAFKDRLIEMVENGDVREIDKASIYVIMNELDPYNENILIAYYGIVDCSASALAKLFGVSCTVISQRINKIIKDVHNRSLVLVSDNSVCSGL